MKFFIPAASSPDEATRVYASIKTHLGQGLGTQFADRKIRALQWTYDGKNYEAEVGQTAAFNGEQVIAILYEPQRDLFHVCTPNRGVLRNMSILAGGHSVHGVIDFTEE
jgi:hypothetical protein